jgi:23S rRNA (cytidine2498-2'-O)-methyltransferase
LPLEPGARVAELGSSPGGATQALLSRGCQVLGVDPAEMAPIVLANPNFRHLRGRTTELPKKEFRKIRWLASDMNVAPNYTLDAVEDIVMNKQVSIRGLILTLKLVEWDLAWDIPKYLERIRSWGFNVIKARQLQHNRQEICVAALQTPFRRKS